MRYDEKEEIESTKEWFLRFNEVGFADELEYVPTELWKLGVPLTDVVDRLDWLKENARGTVDESTKKAITRGPTAVIAAVEEQAGSVLVLERPEEPDPEPEVDLLESELETLMTGSEVQPLVLDYDSFGPWAWAEPIERMVEEAIHAILDPVPGLLEFNELASLTKQRKGQRRRGKTARATQSLARVAG